MAKEKYIVVRGFAGSIVHTVVDGEALTILLDAQTDQTLLEKLYLINYEGVTKL
jgi:hypothetical protein